jgi:signal transduction histidine kinase
MPAPRLLLVDDEKRFRQVLAKRLERRGLPALQAPDGESGLAILADTPVDVMVLDMKMPGLSGLDVLKRAKQTYPDMEIILLTGHASTLDGVAGIKAGAFDYLTKPVEIEHLAGKIRQAQEKILRDREKREEADFRARMESRMVAAERLASLGALAAGVAHEINNPLAVINDAAGWLQEVSNQNPPQPPLDKFLAKGLEKIVKSVERARLVTHQLLSHARGAEPSLADTDIGKLGDEVLQLVGKQARNKNITLSVDVQGDAHVLSDPNQLRQVLINLASNAIHATDKGGFVAIRVEGKDKFVDVTVTDNGKGISEENLPHLFEPFFSTKPAGEGTGLGLFVTGGILTRLGGAIDVSSTVGKGATFTITLPRKGPKNGLCAHTDPLTKDNWVCRLGRTLEKPVSDAPREDQSQEEQP